jgi:glucose 1-dehydrogenase
VAERVALVMGANTGIGLAIAERLLADGWKLGYAAQDNESRHEGPLADLQQRYGEGRVHWVWGSIAEPDVPELLVAETVEAFGSLDALVNNAGLSTAKPFLELTVHDFDLTFDVDVRGSFLAAQAAVRRMKEQRGGSIVNITSVHEHIPRPDVTGSSYVMDGGLTQQVVSIPA